MGEHFQAAHDAGFQQVVKDNAWPGFSNEGTLCEFVEERTRESFQQTAAAS